MHNPLKSSRPRPLEEQVVVITGASSGIGRETAMKFARNGATVVLAARGEIALHDVLHDIEPLGGRAAVVVTDVGDSEQVNRLARAAVDRFGRIDTWVNNAAVSEYATLEQMSIDEINRIVQVDLLGTVYGCRAAVEHMKRSGGGTIINVGSVLSERSVPLQSIYCAAKHGVKGFTEALRLELQHDHANIHLTLIMPSSINTPFFSNAQSKMGVRPAPIPPVYDPHIVADAIVECARSPRRDVFIGGFGKLLSVMERVAAGMLDRYMTQGGRAFRQQQTDEPDHGQSNLFEPAPGTGSVRGEFGENAMQSSFYTKALDLHPNVKRVLVASAAAGMVALVAMTASRAAPSRSSSRAKR